MGTWGTGIFDDDLALDIQGSFEDALAEGLGVATATNRVLEEYAEAAQDHDEGAVVYLALVALQLEHETVQDHIREKVLTIIAAGQGLDRWREVGGKTLDERRQVLENLGASLSV